MPTTFVKGDIFQDPGQGGGRHAFAFAASTNGALDAGVSVAFAKKYPGLAAAVRARAEQSGGEIPMGEVVAYDEGETTVFALSLLRKVKPARISNVTQALEALVAAALPAGITRIALPRIGGGKTDLDWMRVKRVLGEIGDKTVIDLVVYQQFIRNAGAAEAAAAGEASEDEAAEPAPEEDSED